jgi:hypothetical protein
MIKGLHKKGVCALDFNTTGKLLLSVSVDNPSTFVVHCFLSCLTNYRIAIHKWQTGTSIAETTAKTRIFVAKFRPGSDTQVRLRRS